MQTPKVSLLPPAQDLVYAHHGRGGTRIALDEGGALGAQGCGQGGTHVFHNPWRSWRMPSLSDAMLAYQRGAAIAVPQLPTPVSSRPPSRSNTTSQFNHHRDAERSTPQSQEQSDRQPIIHYPSWLKPDEPEDAAEEDDEESQDEDSEMAWANRHTVDHQIKGYIRPTFKRILSQDDQEDWREPPLWVERPQWSTGGDKPLVTWIGHASVLVQIPWTTKYAATPYCNILYDPIFSYRCSPSQLVGPARHLDPPCRVDELPPIHACCISHDHYDHLDYQTILDLWTDHSMTIHFFVPLGLKQWFKSCNIPEGRITELDWYHEAIMSISASDSHLSGYPPETNPTIDPNAAITLKVAFTPGQHRSGRGIFDHMTSLWGSWTIGVVGPGRETAALRPGMKDWDEFKVFFGGDTGYRYASADEEDESAVCPAFQEIADRYAPFSLALLPLSTGSSLPFLRSLLSLSLDQYTLTSSQHCSPADSLDIHLILKSQRSLGMHWGTFCDAAEARATRVEFGRARREKNVSKDWDSRGENGAFIISDIGVVLEI